MRQLITESWDRSVAAGIDADQAQAALALERDELLDYRSGHMLSAVFPLLYDVLGRAAEDCDCVMAVGDSRGRMLWLCGRPGLLRQAEGIRFVEGSDWSEESAGTNAPGTAITLDSAVQISSREHFSAAFKDWSCAAAPIHHPETQQIIGVLDITGTDVVDTPLTLAMVRSAARMAEAELGRLLVTRKLGGLISVNSPTIKLSGLGRPDLLLERGGEQIRLSRRHSDIVAVLADEPDGLSADQLAMEIYDDDMQPSTMRAQMTRLRTLLGDGLLESRPYRLRQGTRIGMRLDWVEAMEALRDNRLADALRLYRGPLLPLSEAPGVIERRFRLERELTQALLASRDPDLLASATRMKWASDNLELWERHTALLPPDSPLRTVAVSEVRRLRQMYAIDRTPSVHRLPGW